MKLAELEIDDKLFPAKINKVVKGAQSLSAYMMNRAP
jgi:hypothetical protein